MGRVLRWTLFVLGAVGTVLLVTQSFRGAPVRAQDFLVPANCLFVGLVVLWWERGGAERRAGP